MCREGAWAELTVKVTCMGVVRSKMHGILMEKYIIHMFFETKWGEDENPLATKSWKEQEIYRIFQKNVFNP